MHNDLQLILRRSLHHMPKAYNPSQAYALSLLSKSLIKSNKITTKPNQLTHQAKQTKLTSGSHPPSLSKIC